MAMQAQPQQRPEPQPDGGGGGGAPLSYLARVVGTLVRAAQDWAEEAEQRQDEAWSGDARECMREIRSSMD